MKRPKNKRIHTKNITKRYTMTVLDFEKPIAEIQEKIDELKKISMESGMDLDKEILLFAQPRHLTVKNPSQICICRSINASHISLCLLRQ